MGVAGLAVVTVARWFVNGIMRERMKGINDGSW